MIATISPKGQLVLPQEVRDQLGWSEGDRVHVEPDGEGRVILEKVKSVPKGTALLPPLRAGIISSSSRANTEDFNRPGLRIFNPFGEPRIP
jgi:AbrB family looped-hinge helix DNA binding protein